MCDQIGEKKKMGAEATISRWFMEALKKCIESKEYKRCICINEREEIYVVQHYDLHPRDKALKMLLFYYIQCVLHCVIRNPIYRIILKKKKKKILTQLSMRVTWYLPIISLDGD